MDDNTTISLIVISLALIIAISVCINKANNNKFLLLKNCNGNIECINSILRGNK